jgi:hypothetical protein
MRNNLIYLHFIILFIVDSVDTASADLQSALYKQGFAIPS